MANAAIRLRGAGNRAPRIYDVAGMSVMMVEHDPRHADRKASGQAEPRENKRYKNGQQTECFPKT
ncbi:phage integrase family protein [Rhodovulum sulfidophilum]|uniref:Phage integrase family protein n=1 Tax=Rhodovulum sulfidophilum TaxID=35806 RepID=A0A0D6B3E7_RHOSU|nr:phage integrase family protein [Rhodovulum sulfidophilum]